jgi:putative membrane-bound dehydrogenase-like protein
MTQRFRCYWLLSLVLLLPAPLLLAQDAIPASSQPLSPAAAQASFVLAEPDLKIELVAAEPEVIDPIAIRFDEQGRMWVVEMGDYPLGPPPGKPPLSRIKILQDLDGDGRFETATVFADKLSFVTGLQPWKGGVIVTLGGRIAWMKDTNGDNKVDVDETWYTGFAEQNSQLRANHPRLALDNYVYVANGLRGGVVVNKRLTDEKPINLQGRDFRFDPRTGKAEAISGNGQFGLCFDDWGNRFTCTNRNPAIHVVLEDRYLKMAPKIPIPSVVQDVAAAGDKSRVFPISRAWTTSNLHAGTFTAACGVHVYRGNALQNVLGDNSVFTCDPTGNFVHREVMQPDGPSFTSTPAYEGKEFLASPDEWFRPVSVETGPDGCLYVVDMYRCVIEHPDFVPDELKKRPDLRLGDDRGRIWRIVQRSAASLPQRDERNRWKLDSLEPTQLGALLAHTNAWQRETAQRLILEAADPRNVDELKKPLATDRELRREPQRYVHTLWLLHGLGKLDADSLGQFLKSASPEVKRQALLVAEELLNQKKIESKDVVVEPSDHAPLAFQSLLFDLSQQGQRTSNAIDPRTLPVEQGSKYDRWWEAAVLLRNHRDLLALFQATLDQPQEREHLQMELARLIGSRGADPEALQLLKGSSRFAESKLVKVVDELARGLQQRNRKLEDLLNELPRQDGQNWNGLLTKACAGIVADKQRPSDSRLAAARLLGSLTGATSYLVTLIEESADADREIQAALVASLAQRGAESSAQWQEMLAAYEEQSLAIKRALVDNSFRRGDGPALLLEQVKTGVIQPAEIDPLRRKNLLESKDAAIKKLAVELFASLNPANRQQALEDYQPVLKMAADAKRGALVFEKNCSSCHRVGDIGVNVAPDISDTRTKTPAQLLADIIQPNRAIDSNFIGYQVLLRDGTTVTGLLSAETSTSITLKQPGGKVLSVSRDEVEAIKATGVSLMPDGLEKNIPPQAMADLLAYLKNWRYLDGKTPLSN